MQTINWQIKKVNIVDLKDWEKNPRKLSGEGYKQLKESIEKYGFHDVLKIDTDDTIISGHQRKRVLQEMGIETIDVLYPDRKLTDKEMDVIAIKSNRHEGEFDFDILGNMFELEILLESGFKETELGFDLYEDKIYEDAVPDVPKISNTKIGDIYILGSHRLMCGNVLSQENIEKLFDGKKANMVFTDPPYNVSYEGKTKEKLTIKNDSFKTNQSFYDFLRDFLLKIKPFVIGDLYICMSSSEIHTIQKVFVDVGGHWSTFIIWIKNTFTLGRSNYQRQYEPILYGWFEGSSHYFAGKRNLGDIVRQTIVPDENGQHYLNVNSPDIHTDIWDFDKPSRNREHPTMKPVALVQRAVVNSSEPNDIILDCFIGGGSTIIACEKTGRICYGMELDPVYVDVAVKRWELFTGKKSQKV